MIKVDRDKINKITVPCSVGGREDFLIIKKTSGAAELLMSNSEEDTTVILPFSAVIQLGKLLQEFGEYYANKN